MRSSKTLGSGNPKNMRGRDRFREGTEAEI